MQYPIQQLAKGRFLTRQNRIVEITGNHTVVEPQPNGDPVSKTVWDGLMYRADGATPDTIGEWEDNGGRRNQQGVATQSDIVQVIEWAEKPMTTADRLTSLQNELAAARHQLAEVTADRDQLAEANRDLVQMVAELKTPAPAAPPAPAPQLQPVKS